MDELLKAIKSMPATKKKIHTVTIQGKTIEVSLEQSLDVQKHGEDAFILQDGKLARKPIEKKHLQSSVLKKDKRGCHFYDDDPFWIEKIDNEGYTWQIESE